jgi:hypothetical protein
VPVVTFLEGLVAGTLLFVGFHTLLGFIAGPGVGAVLNSLNIPVVPVLVALALGGLAGWFIIRARRSAGRAEGNIEPLVDWTDACCPVCLAAARLAQANSDRLQLTPTRP